MDVLGIVYSIPLLHWERFPDGFTCLEQEIRTHNGSTRTKLLKLLAYMRREWLPKAAIVSVYDAPWRTNNFIESANRYLRKHCGVHPNLYNLLGTLMYFFNANYLQILVRKTNINTY